MPGCICLIIADSILKIRLVALLNAIHALDDK